MRAASAAGSSNRLMPRASLSRMRAGDAWGGSSTPCWLRLTITDTSTMGWWRGVAVNMRSGLDPLFHISRDISVCDYGTMPLMVGLIVSQLFPQSCGFVRGTQWNEQNCRRKIVGKSTSRNFLSENAKFGTENLYFGKKTIWKQLQ